MENYPTLFNYPQPNNCSTESNLQLSSNLYAGHGAGSGSASGSRVQEMKGEASSPSQGKHEQGSIGEKEASKKKGERKVKRQRYAFQTRSQVDILDDGYRWRKYGQKAVKNNKFPRFRYIYLSIYTYIDILSLYVLEFIA